MVIIALVLATGMGLAAVFWNAPDPLWLEFLPIAIPVAVLCPAVRLPAVALVGALLFVGQGLLLAISTAAPPGDARVAGCVTGIARAVDDPIRFRMRVEQRDQQRLPIAMLVSVNWYGAPRVPGPGKCLHLELRDRAPRARLNPAGFDPVRWLYTEGVSRQGYVRAFVSEASHTSGGQIDRLRLALAARIERVLGNADGGGLVTALALGIRDGVPGEIRALLRDTGTAHLLAVSGLHVGLVGAVGVALTGACAARWQRRWAAFRVGAAGGAVCAISYALLAGFSLPTQRALVLVLVVLATRWAGVGVRPAAVLGLAAVLLLSLDPAAVLAPGTWLSFGAVAVLLYGMSMRPMAKGGLRLALRIQVIATLGLAPLVLVVFGQLPVLGVVANLLAVPLVGLLVVPLTLAGLGVLLVAEAAGALFLGTAAGLLHLLVEFLRIIDTAGLMLLPSASPTSLGLALAVPGLLLALAHPAMPGRWLAVLLLAPLLAHSPPRPPTGVARVTTLSVGQGTAVVVTTANRVLIHDTGPARGRYSAARSIIVPMLKRLGRTRIDLLVVSHPDLDHAGGVSALMAAMPVHAVVGEPRHATRPAAIACPGAYRWRWDNVDFELRRAPLASASRNDRSCVLRISAGPHSVLLAGDIERRAERALLESGGAGRAEVLVAPHHGSRTSSGARFVRAVQPAMVVFSVGEGNRFGFPHAEVIDRYRAAGSRLLSTDHDGAVTVSIGGDTGVQVRTRAPDALRLWHRRAPGLPD